MRDLRPALWIFGVLACAPLAAKLGAEAYLLSLATHALIFAIAALSLDFVLGHGALVSFGHAAFLGIGAYAVAMLSRWGYDEIVVQLLAAISAAAVFALATGAISLRASGVYYIMSTLAFGQMLYFFFVSLSAWGGDDGVTLDARSRLFGASVLEERRRALLFRAGRSHGLLGVGRAYRRLALRPGPRRHSPKSVASARRRLSAVRLPADRLRDLGRDVCDGGRAAGQPERVRLARVHDVAALRESCWSW